MVNSHFKYKQNISPLIILSIYAIISGFRYDLGGSDYEYYQYFYDRITSCPNLILAYAESEYEVGYTLFIYICSHYLNLSFNGYLVVESVLFYTFMYLGLRKYVPSWGLFLILFTYKIFFYVTFVAMRQAITVAGFYYIMKFLESRNFIKYHVALSLVATFHYGALLLFVLYPLRNVNFTRRLLVILGLVFAILTPFAGLTGTIISFGVSVLGLNSLEDKAAGYTGGESLNILYTIEYYIIYLGLLKFYDQIVKYKHSQFMIYLFVLVLPIVTILRSSSIFVRELFYFYPSYAFILFYIFKFNKKNAFFYKFIFSTLCLAGVIKYLIQFGNGCLMPYNTWIFNPEINFFK